MPITVHMPQIGQIHSDGRHQCQSYSNDVVVKCWYLKFLDSPMLTQSPILCSYVLQYDTHDRIHYVCTTNCIVSTMLSNCFKSVFTYLLTNKQQYIAANKKHNNKITSSAESRSSIISVSSSSLSLSLTSSTSPSSSSCSSSSGVGYTYTNHSQCHSQ